MRKKGSHSSKYAESKTAIGSKSFADFKSYRKIMSSTGAGEALSSPDRPPVRKALHNDSSVELSLGDAWVDSESSEGSADGEDGSVWKRKSKVSLRRNDDDHMVMMVSM